MYLIVHSYPSPYMVVYVPFSACAYFVILQAVQNDEPSSEQSCQIPTDRM